MEVNLSTDIGWLVSNFPNLINIQHLASGGQKNVFSCEHPRFGCCVLKLLKPGSDEARVFREIDSVSRIESNNIPKIFDSGKIGSQLGDLFWILEERIDGETLTEVISKPVEIGRSEIIRMGRTLLTIIISAQGVNVVHRDIKPANIFRSPDGKFWLLDFGIARVLDMQSLTRDEASSGPHTPGYGAPEQFHNRKKEIDNRADLFAIGIVLYECITKVNPFTKNARDRLDVLNRVEKMPLPEINKDWVKESGLDKLILSLSQKFPHQRPSPKEAFDWFNEISHRIEG